MLQHLTTYKAVFQAITLCTSIYKHSCKNTSSKLTYSSFQQTSKKMKIYLVEKILVLNWIFMLYSIIVQKLLIPTEIENMFLAQLCFANNFQ